MTKTAFFLASALLLGSAPAIAADAPTDPQIAHIAYTAGDIDVTAAKQALAQSRTPSVRSFAQEMVRDHQAVNEKALALVKKLHVTPEDNPTSQALTKAAAEERTKLAKLRGAAFDRAYVDHEVSAKNGELKSLLETGLTLFREHQAHAEHIAKALK